MKAVNLKNKRCDVFSPTTHVNCVVDENGIDLATHLELIYSELGKRDVKRIYRSIGEITNKINPSTFTILSEMAENTLAVLSLENDSYLINEIGSRLGGVMVLIKQSSVYFSCGVFFTYRYGEVFTGVSGIGGESFLWSGNTKTIHSYHSGTASTINAVNTYEKISGWGGLTNNSRLTNENGTIIIPKGVSLIMISAYVVVEIAEEGDKFLQIFKNGEPSSLMVKANVAKNATLSFTPLMMDVEAGDEIELRYYSNSLDTLRSKHMTIEIIN